MTKYWVRANAGALFATGLFAAMFTYYLANHQAGASLNVLITATNKGVLLALVAMAQTLPVLTGGLDLSVGMVFVLANCLASRLVDGPPAMTALGIVAVLAAGLAAGFFNGVIVVYGRLQPIITTLAGLTGPNLPLSNAILIVVNVANFRPLADYRRDVGLLVQVVKSLPRREGFDELMLPGERGGREAELRRRNGIPLPPKLWRELGEIAKSLGIAPAQARA